MDPYATRASVFERLHANDPANRETAWAEFHARYAPMIAGFARRCGANRQDVQDIVGDVIAGFVASSADFVYDPAKGRFRGWLKTVAVRAALRRAGKNLRFRGVPLEDVPAVELAVDGLWNDVWEDELVARAIQLVREQDAGPTFEAFDRYVLRERPAAAVAAELGTSVESVYQAKIRVTRRLREVVGRMRDADG